MMTLKQVSNEIAWIKKKLRAYEAKHGLSTEEFFARYLAGEGSPPPSLVPDMTEWSYFAGLLDGRQDLYKIMFESEASQTYN